MKMIETQCGLPVMTLMLEFEWRKRTRVSFCREIFMYNMQPFTQTVFRQPSNVNFKRTNTRLIEFLNRQQFVNISGQQENFHTAPHFLWLEVMFSTPPLSLSQFLPLPSLTQAGLPHGYITT